MNVKRTLFRLTTAGLVITLPASTTHVSAAAETSPTVHQVQEISAEDQRVMSAVLDYIDSIPDDVVANSTDEELAAYIQNRQRMTARNAWERAGAIALIAAGTVVPIAKVVSLVRLVKSLGGARKAARAIEEAGGIKTILATKGKSIKSKDIRNALLEVAAELSGIGLAMEKC